MTIRKGEPWGTPVERPDELVTVHDDAELAEILTSDAIGPVGVTGGDLHRSLGSPPERTEMQRLPIDLIDVVADRQSFVAVAHVIVRRGWWRGRIVAACNVDRVGEWDVAPRAHPNDGRIDTIDVDPSMTIRERWQARQRLAGGTHVPHPRITTTSVRSAVWEFDRPFAVWIDGRHRCDARAVTVRVRPDAATVWV